MQLGNEKLENEILQSEIPVLVKFFAKWCGPCKVMQPIFEELEQEFHNQAKFIKIDVEENQYLANKFIVLSLPTFLIYKNGKRLKQLTGVQEKQVLAQTLKQL